MDNYRPVALLSNFSKIFEKLFLKRLTTFLEKFAILKPEQYGFQKNKSTTSTVFDLIKQVSEHMDSKTSHVVMFF